MNIYLLRHGETTENNRKSYYGSIDSQLNEVGKLQAQKAMESLSGIKFNKIYTSERKRAIDTACLALNCSSKDLIVDLRLNERSFGLFEGKTFEEASQAYPSEYKLWSDNWKDYKIPNGESFSQFYLKISSFMNELIKTNNENILIVTHGGVIRTIYCYVLGGNLDAFWNFTSKNGDLSLVKYEFENLFIDSIIHTKLK